jgi:hypothetical protein
MLMPQNIFGEEQQRVVVRLWSIVHYQTHFLKLEEVQPLQDVQITKQGALLAKKNVERQSAARDLH